MKACGNLRLVLPGILSLILISSQGGEGSWQRWRLAFQRGLQQGEMHKIESLVEWLKSIQTIFSPRSPLLGQSMNSIPPIVINIMSTCSEWHAGWAASVTLDSCIEAIKVSVQDVHNILNHNILNVLTGYNFRLWWGPPSSWLIELMGGILTVGESREEAYALFWCIDASRLMAVFMQQCERADAEEARAERDENWEGTDLLETWRLRWMVMTL